MHIIERHLDSLSRTWVMMERSKKGKKKKKKKGIKWGRVCKSLNDHGREVVETRKTTIYRRTPPFNCRIKCKGNPGHLLNPYKGLVVQPLIAIQEKNGVLWISSHGANTISIINQKKKKKRNPLITILESNNMQKSMQWEIQRMPYF